jgi:hypothetical protein
MAKNNKTLVIILAFCCVSYNLTAQTNDTIMGFLESFWGKSVTELPNEVLRSNPSTYTLDRTGIHFSESISFICNSENKIHSITYLATSTNPYNLSSLAQEIFNYMDRYGKNYSSNQNIYSWLIDGLKPKHIMISDVFYAGKYGLYVVNVFISPWNKKSPRQSRGDFLFYRKFIVHVWV